MKKQIIAWCLLSSMALVHAHDEGHGPQLADVGQQGGLVTAVVAKKDAAKGAKAALVYKAELVRWEDGKVSVYLYDKKMKPLNMAAFNKTAQASLISEKRGKQTVASFPLALAEGAYTGNAPAPASKPFHIDVTFVEGDRQWLAAFDNLD